MEAAAWERALSVLVWADSFLCQDAGKLGTRCGALAGLSPSFSAIWLMGYNKSEHSGLKT